MRKLPVYLVIVLLSGLSIVLLRTDLVNAQGDETQISDFALDIQQGEKDTANDVDAQNNQQDVGQSEQIDAAADDGDSSTDLEQVSVDESVQSQEAQESAKLVENPTSTSSENDNGETLKDQSTQSPGENANADVNTQDDNKAPATDQGNQPQSVEQPLDQIQQLPGTQSETPQSDGGQGQTETNPGESGQ